MKLINSASDTINGFSKGLGKSVSETILISAKELLQLSRAASSQNRNSNQHQFILHCTRR